MARWETQPGGMSAYRAGIGFPIGQTVDEAKIIIKYAKLKPKKTISIEIGTRNGGSTLLIAMNTFDPVVTIDIKEDPRVAQLLNESTGEVHDLYHPIPPLRQHWAIYPGGSRIEKVTAVSWEVQESRPVGLVFIDGGHEYEDVLRDWNNFWPMIVPGGYCLIHDYEKPKFPGVTQFIHDVPIDFIDRGGSIVVYQKENENGTT